MLAPDARAARAAGGGFAMSTGTTPATSEQPEFVESGEAAPQRRRRLGCRRGGAWWWSCGGRPRGGQWRVRRRRGQRRVACQRVGDVVGDGHAPVAVEQTQFNGTLGYAGSYTVLGQAHGTVTWLPEVGQVVHQGQVLYRVDGAPVVLLYGSTPAYRALAEGATAADVTGADVAQLNHDLVALGYVDKADVDSAWDEFSWATKAGVEKLQNHLGVDQTGELALGDVVFLPTAARVTALQASLGAPAAGPVLSASSTARTVSVALDAGPAIRGRGRRPGHDHAAGRQHHARHGHLGGQGRHHAVEQLRWLGRQRTAGRRCRCTSGPRDPTATGSLDQALVRGRDHRPDGAATCWRCR